MWPVLDGTPPANSPALAHHGTAGCRAGQGAQSPLAQLGGRRNKLDLARSDAALERRDAHIFVDQARPTLLRVAGLADFRHADGPPDLGPLAGQQVVVRLVALVVVHGLQFVARAERPTPGKVAVGRVAVDANAPRARFLVGFQAGCRLVELVDGSWERPGGANGGRAVVVDGELEDEQIALDEGQCGGRR